MRLSIPQVPPAGLVSYALGLCRVVPLHKYILASSLGSTANVLAYVYIGVLLTSLEALHHGDVSLTPEGTSLVVGSLVASVGLMCWLARVGDARLAEARASGSSAEASRKREMIREQLGSGEGPARGTAAGVLL